MHIVLSGALTAEIASSGIVVACGEGSVRGAFTVSATSYWLEFETRSANGDITARGTPSVWLRNQTGAANEWTGDGHASGFSSGITKLDTNTGASVHSTLIPSDAFAAPGINQAKSNVNVTATIVCPPPGSPSQITVSGAIRGPITVTHVNCDLPNPQASVEVLDVVGQLNGSTYTVSLQQSANGLSVSVTGNGKAWTGTANAGNQFSVMHGATFSATLTLDLGQGGLDTSAPTLTISGTATCPS